jgi:hypothetical protein
MRFARWSFRLAGIYGLIALLPLYGQAPLNAASLWMFGFAGAAAATQLAYLLIGSDPLRYRMVIPVGIVSKLSFFVPVTILYRRGEVPGMLMGFALTDLALAALFAVNFVRLGRISRS